MFEVGKVYEITLLEPHPVELAEVTYPNCEVIEVDGTLIKYRSGPYERILNTTSPHFHSAATQLVEDLR